MLANFLVPSLLDSAEWFAMLTFTLTLFRLRPLRFWQINVLLALMLKMLTLIVKQTPLYEYLALVQIAMIVLAFVGLYRIRLLHSCVIALVGGIIIFLASMALTYLRAYFFQLDYRTLVHSEGNTDGYALSMTVLIALTFFMAWTVKRLRLGFSFVSSTMRQPRLNGVQFGVPLCFSLGVTVMLPPSGVETQMPLLIFGVLICLVLLLIASYRTELEDAK